MKWLTMASKLFFNLEDIKPQISNSGGCLTIVNGDEAPGFVNIAFALLQLNKGGSQDPIWHPNAHKIGYCQQGNALVSIRSPGATDNFTVKEGDIFFIPQGYVHQIANVGVDDAIIAFALNNTMPEKMYLSKAVYSLSDSVFTSTFKTPNTFYDGLKKSKKEDLFKILPQSRGTPDVNSTRFKFNINSSNKVIQSKGGYLQLGTKTVLPTLEGLGILRFGLTPKGVVEPHWHTNAGELVYIVKGQTRITVLSPDGNVEVMEVNGGQGAFAPASHFHNIENVGDVDVEVIAFFTHDNPDYIGVGEVVGSYSNEVLASVFNVSPSYFDAFRKPSAPLVIVPI
jgi:oxalate decarboxylase